jgi:hypothetical protein
MRYNSTSLFAAALLIIYPLFAQAMTNTEAKALAISAVKGDASNVKELEQAAVKGDATAQSWLGVYYVAQKNYVTANAWLLKAAEQGNAGAENNLGFAYYYGQGVPQNYAHALYWYQKAAAQGDTVAQNNLNALSEQNSNSAYSNNLPIGAGIAGEQEQEQEQERAIQSQQQIEQIQANGGE